MKRSMVTVLSIFVMIFLLMAASVPAVGCIGARAASMGYAGVSCVNDATAAYWNPSLIPDIDSGFSYGNDAINRFHFALVQNSFGFSLYYADDGHSYITAVKGLRLSDSFSIGGGITLHHYGSSSLLPDCGQTEFEFGLIGSATLKVSNFKFAVLIQDYNVRPSLCYESDYFTLVYESYDCFNYYDLKHVRLGCELKIGFLALRYGIESHDSLTIYTYGVGIKLGDNIEIDYYHPNYNHYRYSISLTL
jgi:hypothetical protein